MAASQNKPAVVKALLLLGARLNVKTRRGLTPEDLARRNGFEEVLRILEQAALQKESTLGSLPPSHSSRSMASKENTLDTAEALESAGTSRTVRIQM